MLALFGFSMFGVTSSALASSSIDEDADPAKVHDRHTTAEFAIADIYVEVNATDGDTEIVMIAKGGDNGFKSFRVKSPDGRNVIDAESKVRSVMGRRELAYESPEPAGDAILASCPEGLYKFSGTTHEGQEFMSEDVLSDELPAATIVATPTENSVVPVESVVIECLTD